MRRREIHFVLECLLLGFPVPTIQIGVEVWSWLYPHDRSEAKAS